VTLKLLLPWFHHPSYARAEDRTPLLFENGRDGADKEHLFMKRHAARPPMAAPAISTGRFDVTLSMMLDSLSESNVAQVSSMKSPTQLSGILIQ